MKDEVPVMYLSFAMSGPETRYHTTEQEALAVVRCLEEVRWSQGVLNNDPVYS